MYCRKCGTLLDDDALFARIVGKKFKKRSPQKQLHLDTQIKKFLAGLA